MQRKKAKNVAPATRELPSPLLTAGMAAVATAGVAVALAVVLVVDLLRGGMEAE